MTSSRQVEYLPLSELAENPKNPKNHELQTVGESISRFGMIDPIVRDERTGFLIAGHGRKNSLEALRNNGETPPEGVQVAEDGEWLVPVLTGWGSRSDTEANAALIALNRTTEIGGWDDEALAELLDELAEVEDGLEGVGYNDEELSELSERLEHFDIEADLESEEPLEKTGESFKDLDVLWGEPRHEVQHGEIYLLGGRHYLVIAKVSDEHSSWAGYLAGRVFAPYPDVYLSLGEDPKQREYLFVQPNKYLAGHLLDKWTSVHGEESLEKVDK